MRGDRINPEYADAPSMTSTRPMRTANRLGRGPRRARAASDSTIAAPTDVADLVEALEDLAEDRSARSRRVRQLPRRHDVEHGRRRDRPEGEQAAHPDHDGQEGCVAQRKHPVIIIDGRTSSSPPCATIARLLPFTMPQIAWLPWSAASFARARAERKPVLLSIVASLVAGLPRDGRRPRTPILRVASIVDERFVPIRVDADRRPDISERYSLGGWPTTAFLTG